MNPIILVSGSRDFADPAALYAVLHELKPASIHVGDCGMEQLEREPRPPQLRSADVFAYLYCQELNIQCHQFKADWTHYGKRAGPIRNGIMVNDWFEISKPWNRVAVFCWIDGPCKGTRDCFARVNGAKNRATRIIHVGPVPGDLK